MDNKTTGKFIAECRKELGLTQSQLAEKLGVTDKAVSKWETGKGAPDISSLTPLAETLNVSVVEILNGSKIDKENIVAEADIAITDVMQKTRKKLVISIVIAVVVTIFVTSIYPMYRYVTSVSLDDMRAIEKVANEIIEDWSTTSVVNYEPYELIRYDFDGDYLALLLQNTEKMSMVIFEKDTLYENRVSYMGGSGLVDRYEIDAEPVHLYSSGNTGMSINVFWGTDIPENIASFSYNYNGATHVYPIEDGTVLEISVDFNEGTWTHPNEIEVQYK